MLQDESAKLMVFPNPSSVESDYQHKTGYIGSTARGHPKIKGMVEVL